MTSHADRIDELLSQASDPVQRAIVIVLSNINRELVENTKATHALAAGIDKANAGIGSLDRQLSGHISEEEVLVAGFRGRVAVVGWIAPILFAILAAAGSYIWAQQAEMIAELKMTTKELHAALIVVSQKQLVSEERDRRMEGNAK